MYNQQSRTLTSNSPHVELWCRLNFQSRPVGNKIDGEERIAWTLPYVVTVNKDYPFGLSVAYPRQVDGEREDDRLKWYYTAKPKDIILSAEVTW